MKEINNLFVRFSNKRAAFICCLSRQKNIRCPQNMSCSKENIIILIEFCSVTEVLWQRLVLESPHDFEKSCYYLSEFMIL